MLRYSLFFSFVFALLVVFAAVVYPNNYVFAAGKSTQGIAHSPLDNMYGHPPLHVFRRPSQPTSSSPTGLTPSEINGAYHLPGTGGSGTIAIIDAYDDPNVFSDLTKFSSYFGLPAMQSQCTPTSSSARCFEKVTMAGRIKSNSGWAIEESLDTQWAHAIAPDANILLVEAKSNSLTDLLNAEQYAITIPNVNVVAVSMSWGAGEFSGESTYDNYFTSNNSISFFASSGDSGTGVQWPAVSDNVVGVGGTTLNIANDTESAWSGSGGGLSKYESEPPYQSDYNIPNDANNFRAVPDVSFDADPSTGVAVYDSVGYQRQKGWLQVGGTSLGAPSWAAIRALGGANVSNSNFYQDALTSSSYSTHFRDIKSGSNSNSTCTNSVYCTAAAGYDYITGLGSPLTVSY